MFLYFDDRIKPARVYMGMMGTEIVFGFAIVIICPMVNLFHMMKASLSTSPPGWSGCGLSLLAVASWTMRS